MGNFITGKIGVKVSLKVNLVILVVMVAGTYYLVTRQRQSLEEELLNRGKIQSIVGAKMIGMILEEAIDNGVFSINDAFDTNYEQIGSFDPPKFHTKYDSYLDKAILGIEDEFLLDKSIVFAVAVDKNGYLPTHNSRYQKPITGDREKDKVGNRTKRVFNDPVGIKAAKNVTKGFQQVYHRDTGVTMWDISSPIFVKGKHWGGFRIGLSLEVIDKAKRQLMNTLVGIMGVIFFISILLTFIIVNSSLAPVKILAGIADGLANGKYLQEEIPVTTKDEVGALQASLDRLRLSMLIALKRKKK
jgi:HAMP domain-containing protein